MTLVAMLFSWTADTETDQNFICTPKQKCRLTFRRVLRLDDDRRDYVRQKLVVCSGLKTLTERKYTIALCIQPEDFFSAGRRAEVRAHRLLLDH